MSRNTSRTENRPESTRRVAAPPAALFDAGERLLGPAPRCEVCHSQHVFLDEVDVTPEPASDCEQVLLLGSCDHCDHRWTEARRRPARLAARRVRPELVLLPEVASAA